MTETETIRVLLLENIHASALEVLGEKDGSGKGFEVTSLPGALKEDELRARLAGVHVLGIRSKTQVPRAVLESAKDLLAVGCFCIGTNQVDVAAANTSGVPVFNAPFSNTRSVAELVIGEVIALSRQLGDRSREVHEGRWRKVATGCHEVRGKTLGIVGYGHIGSQVGVLAEAMGMRVVFFDIATKLPMGNNRSVASLHDLLGQSDFVTLHVPATRETKDMIGAREVAAMRKGTHLLNLSRGSVVTIRALADGLRSGHLGGAAVDVYPSEPESNSDGFESELRGLPNVLLTPHVGGSTEEAQEAIGREVATTLVRLVRMGTTVGAVNFPQVEVPMTPGKHRVLNVHKNVPGVLGAVNRIVSEHDANISAQMLRTDESVGYLVMDLDQEVAPEVSRAIAALPTSIRTRIVS